MKKILLLLFISSTAFAQFGPGGGGPGGGRFGGPGGQDGFGQKKEKTFIPGTDTDTQPKGNGKISGILMDSTTSKPVEYATIALINTQTNKPIDGTTADEKGRFTLSKLAPGTYKLQYSFIGYKNRLSAPITIAKGSEINVGVINLPPDVRTLAEATVTGQASMIEERVDRLVYNAEKDVTTKGGDASDVMRKVPMLTVDLDGNLTLRGSSNIQVLINNKPSTIVASSVADALKQIPADMIKSVEVITSPSAKYDAEGSGGIINIVTKKTTLQGLTLDVNSGVGNRGSNLGLNANYRTGKMGFSLSGFGRAEYNVKGEFENTQTTKTANGNQVTIQNASTLTQRLFGNYQLGWDYDIDKNTSLTASVRYGARNGTSTQNGLLTTTYLPGVSNPVLNLRDVSTKDINGNLDANVTYTKTYKPQQELSILGLFSQNNRQNDFTADLLSPTDMHTILSRQRNDNPSQNKESTLQIDYQTPLSQKTLLEFGGKGILRQVNSDYTYFLAQGATGDYVVDNTRQNNSLNYQQQILGAYASITAALPKKFTLKAGARYEYTLLDARFGSEQTGTPISLSNYGNLVPSINISKSLKGNKTLKLAYNRRIQRPGIQFLNPNVNSSNPTNISQGNPYLSPELTDNVELSLSMPLKAVYLTTSLFARRTNNEITSVRDTATVLVNNVAQTAIRTNYQNVGYEDTYGMNVFGNINLSSKLQLNGGFDLMHVNLTNNNANPIYAASNSGWVLGGRLFGTYTIGNGWGLQGGGGMMGRRIQLQGYQGSFAFYNIGFRKEIAQKKGSIGLVAENFLNHPFTVRSESSSSILSQSSVNSFYNAGVRLTFSYKIGKMKFVDSKRKKSIENDDVKGEGGGGNDGQQQAAPAAGGGGRPRS
ncbi:TonB-dependent receptor domain-containing protein [Spirosoma aerolatum]|uniref:TonB-dependent receptor domain-containing protein n=1 Tax=Spirosoma aerolatum TaxID=1211326 RepID=UPI0009ADD477|nr:TonB-dependent receptor [Spirosoma aerolatum]